MYYIGKYADFISMTDFDLTAGIDFTPVELTDEQKLARVERQLDAAYGHYESGYIFPNLANTGGWTSYKIRYTVSAPTIYDGDPLK